MQQNQVLSFPWQLLLDWYKENGRHHLLWRDYTHLELGYRVWLSEILLQQTQVDRVIPFYTRMLAKYPTVQSLAGASYDEFFPYYQGLGYYSRARNILKTAGIVSNDYSGIFPRDKKSLMTLPGVGGYTSSAILAFAYGEPYLSWDTNLEKVFARYYNGRKDIKLTQQQKEQIEQDFHNFISEGYEEQGMGVRWGGTVQNFQQKISSDDENRLLMSKANPERVGLPTDAFDTFGSKSMENGVGVKNRIRAINNALMDFAATVDLKNPNTIDWINYPIQSGVWYDTRGSLEPQETKISQSFPIPDATVIIILHQDHRIYYSDISPSSGGTKDPGVSGFFLLSEGRKNRNSYSPFILQPSLTRDTRRYVQDTFREQYGLELSVRPVHKKWLSTDGHPYIAVNAQIQAGDAGIFAQYSKSDMKTAIEILYSL